MNRALVLVFWFSMAALVYVYVGYLLLLVVTSVFVRRTQQPLGYTPRLSILIAAYNEESGIAKKLEQTLSLDYPAELFEIIVLSDGSNDRTDQIVESFEDPRIRLLRVTGRKGKTNAQNEGAKIAAGDILVFSDATTIYHPKALRYLASNYVDDRVGAVSGRYLYFDADQKSPMGLGTIAFWNYENFIKTLQSRIATISGCCGCIYSVRKRAYTALSADVISDLVQPLHVIRKGYRVAFEDRALAYEETTRAASEEFSMRLRVVTRGMRGLLSVPDLLLPWKAPWVCLQLWSHKILRWLVPIFLIALLVSSSALFASPGYRMVFLAQIAFYGFALFSLAFPIHKYSKLFGVPLYFCTLNVAALCSIIEVLRGEKYTVWQTVRN
jgi:cellulose synthase/poly-beta-1,6-N-acetylglucosamine synthase-like glycosyltransferase